MSPKPLLIFAFLLGLLPCARAFADDSARNRRLPADVVPTFESLRLDVDADRADYQGSAHIELKAERSASSFRFHSEGLKLTSLTLSAGGRAIPATFSPEQGTQITVTPAKPLAKGAYALDIAFSANFNTRAASFYRLTTGGHAYTFTQFESDDARGAFPCWDEPIYKIPWQVTLAVPAQHLALTNTPVERESTLADGRTRVVTFKRSPPMPSYLVAFATGPFDTVAIPGLSVPGRVVTVKGQIALAGEAVRMTPPLLKALERYFGRPYPYEKLDLIAVPEFWYGAMENAGAITFRDASILIDPQRATTSERRRFAETVAHELSHMWFGDLVTLAWWDDMWLNESFASWMGDKVTAEVYPEFHSQIASVAGRRSALVTDARLSTHAVRQPVGDSDNLLEIADALAYNKGQSVLEMFERYLGAEHFRNGVRQYLETWAWGNATGADLWNALSSAGGTNVRTSLPTFLDQPGVPIITVTPLDGGRVKLSQRRFLNAGEKAPGAQLWMVPVALKFGEGAVTRTQTVMLKQSDVIVKLEGGVNLEWIYPNADEAGYYRWSLPPAWLHTIAARAATVLSPRERMGFGDNLGALLDGGLLHGDAYLAGIEPLARDPQPEVVGQAIDAIEKIHETFVDDAIKPAFAGWVRTTLQPALERFGAEPRPGEEEAVAPLRARLLETLADHGDDQALCAKMTALARRYLDDPKAVDPSMVDAAIPIAALHGDRALFDEYRQRFETTTVPSERARFLAALGNFRDTTIVNEVLRYSLTGPLRPQELYRLPRATEHDEVSRDRSYRFMTENYDAIKTRVPEMFMGLLPRIGGGCSLERLAAAEAFFADPKHQGSGWERTMSEVSASVRDCAALNLRESASVHAYLNGARSAN